MLLSAEDRRVVDAELAGQLPGLGDKRAQQEAARIGYRLDPLQAVKRTRKAESERYVSLRPTADSMTHLTALLPVTHGMAA